MTMPKPSFRVGVDVRNPGEFLACCGLLELADRLWPGSEGWFDRDEFLVAAEAPADQEALVHLLQALASCSLEPEKNAGQGKPSATFASLAWKRRQKASEATDGPDRLAPLKFGSPFPLRLDWWREQDGTPTRWKLWAGQQTSQSISTDLQAALRSQLAQVSNLAGPPLFQHRTLLSGRFGFDPGSAWQALDVGFSPNEQGIGVATSPAAELLAAVGLQRFRLRETEPRGSFVYATWGTPLAPLVARAAAAGAVAAPPLHMYRSRLIFRGSYKGFDFATEYRGDEP